MPTENCPSCGAPLETKTRGAVLVVCAYCDSTLLRDSGALSLAGKMAQLQEDGSPLQLGVTGSHRGEPFEVVGRIQLEYDKGFWNEWYLSFPSEKRGWLGEGQGQLAVTNQVRVPRVPAWEAARVGQNVDLGAEGFQIREMSTVRCVSAAGELPFNIQVGYDAHVIDLAGRGRRFATVDYSEVPALVFIGERVEFDELALKGLREFEGW